MSSTREHAVFGVNCYWGGEAAFRKLEGVVETVVGFMADSLSDAIYERCEPTSDQHAKNMRYVEVVSIQFDPAVITYADLIETFWTCHNPAHGPLCPEDNLPSLERSVIFVANEMQHKIAAEACVAAMASERFDAPITTTIEDAGHFHRAVESEQRYLERNAGAVCAMKDAAAE